MNNAFHFTRHYSPGVYLWLGVYAGRARDRPPLPPLRLLFKVNTLWCQQEGDE